MFPRPTSATGSRPVATDPRHGFRRDGTRQDARRRGLVATTERLVEDLERLPTPCFVLLAPAGTRPRNEQPVTNEGGIIRFALGGSSDRDAGAK